MGRFWSFLFLLVPVLGVICFAWAPSAGYWLVEDISLLGREIDQLFYFILFLTGVAFVATEGALFLFMWQYDKDKATKPIRHMHGSHNLEIVWTIVPAGVLLFIAIYQMNAWAALTMDVPEDPAVEVELTGRQFEWRLRYPGPDGKFDTRDDIYHVNDMHVPVNKTVLVHLESMDVLHSFFLPNLRLKQDAVPGMTIPVWFTAQKEGEYDLVCAELCGWGHYKMKGRLTVQSQQDYDAWQAQMLKDQEAVK